MQNEVKIPTPKFNIGDVVINARVTWFNKKVQCPDCLGKKLWRVILPSGEEFDHDCQTCRDGWFSTGLVNDWDDHPVKRHLTIGSVRMDTAEERGPFSYMCVETGIGTGGVYYQSELFATEAEADAYLSEEMERVKGLRQEEELKRRKHKKSESLIHGKRKKK